MKNTKRTTAPTSGQKAETRRDRWHRHIVARLEEIKWQHPTTNFPAEWLEEIEGRPLADALADLIAKNRGFGVAHPTDQQKYYQDIDNYFEFQAQTRGRNSHEKGVARLAVYNCLCPRADAVDRQDIQPLIRRFYKRGDLCLDKAIARAVKSALECKTTA